MEHTTSVGYNRTGFQMSPFDTKEMMEAAENLTPAVPAADGGELDTQRRRFITEAESIGSVPLPGSIKGAVNMTLSKLTGNHPEVLIDKLGERLAFERSGTRLYDALLLKYQAAHDAGRDGPLHEKQAGDAAGELSPYPHLPPRDVLVHIRNEELQHFQVVMDAMNSLGADPTAQTPSADISAVASMGIMQVLTDPRTNLLQCLNAILTAELTDNAGWEQLISLAENLGQKEMAERFRIALYEEQQHLTTIKAWVNKLTLAES